jgi:hypothetical protein
MEAGTLRLVFLASRPSDSTIQKIFVSDLTKNSDLEKSHTMKN